MIYGDKLVKFTLVFAVVPELTNPNGKPLNAVPEVRNSYSYPVGTGVGAVKLIVAVVLEVGTTITFVGVLQIGGVQVNVRPNGGRLVEEYDTVFELDVPAVVFVQLVVLARLLKSK